MAASDSVPSALGLRLSLAVATAAILSSFLRSTSPGTQMLSEILGGQIMTKQPWMEPELSLGDYDYLKQRVVDEYGWDAERARSAIVEYLKFLQMIAESPRMELIASTDIDLVWHEHLMDTSNYAKDCLNLFGHFLHHRRARTSSEYDLIPAAYDRTKQVYASRYGVFPPERFWGAHTQAASMCGGGSVVNPAPPASPTPSQASPTPSSPTASSTPSSSGRSNANSALRGSIFFAILLGLAHQIM